jgi:glycosyltransferase involved in cell wall biosynthesis
MRINLVMGFSLPAPPVAGGAKEKSWYLLARELGAHGHDVTVYPRGVYETGGLAINEAMHLGVPCIVSDRVGCQEDLVTDGVTGWVFAAEDPAQLRARLAEALAADRTALQPAIAARISGYTYARAAAGLLDALASVPHRSA